MTYDEIKEIVANVLKDDPVEMEAVMKELNKQNEDEEYEIMDPIGEDELFGIGETYYEVLEDIDRRGPCQDRDIISSTRRVVSVKVPDENILLEMAKNNKYWEVRKAAKKRLKELKKVVNNDI